MFFGLVKNSERTLEEEKKEAAKLIKKAVNYQDIYEFLANWKDVVRFVKSSKHPELIKWDIKTPAMQRIHRKIGVVSNVDELKTAISTPSNGYKSISELTNDFLNEEEIIRYVFSRERNKRIKKINEIFSDARESLTNGGRFYRDAIIKFPELCEDLSNLYENFGRKLSEDDQKAMVEVNVTMARYGEVYLRLMLANAPPRAISSNSGLYEFERIKTAISDCLSRTNKKLEQRINNDVEEDILKKDNLVNKFARRYLNKKQDALYNVAEQAAENASGDYEQKLNEFIQFSQTYSAILEEDSETIGNIVEDFQEKYRLAYFNKNHPHQTNHVPNKGTSLAHEGQSLEQSITKTKREIEIRYVSVK